MSASFSFIQQATPQDMAQAMAAVCVFTREDMELGAVGQAVDRLMQLSDDDDLARRMEGQVFLLIEGYDTDPRELFQIEECVSFFRAVTEQWPYWFHFLERKSGSLGRALRMLVDVRVTHMDDGVVKAVVEAECLEAVLLRMFKAMAGLQQRLDLDETHTVEASEEVLKALELSPGG